MPDEIKYKKKELQRLIAEDNERELCFLMLYWVYEKDAYSAYYPASITKVLTCLLAIQFRTQETEIP